MSHSVKLFSYGTLRKEAVQLSTFKRKLVGHEDSLSKYRLEDLTITDPEVLATSSEAVHPIAVYSGDATDKVLGTVFDISEAELASADQYEVADYKKVALTLDSGIEAWVYISG